MKHLFTEKRCKCECPYCKRNELFMMIVDTIKDKGHKDFMIGFLDSTINLEEEYDMMMVDYDPSTKDDLEQTVRELVYAYDNYSKSEILDTIREAKDLLHNIDTSKKIKEEKNKVPYKENDGREHNEFPAP